MGMEEYRLSGGEDRRAGADHEPRIIKCLEKQGRQNASIWRQKECGSFVFLLAWLSPLPHLLFVSDPSLLAISLPFLSSLAA